MTRSTEELLKDAEYDCPQCGFETETLHEGYCKDCSEAMQEELDLHNAQYDRWQGLSDEQRANEIKRAIT